MITEESERQTDSLKKVFILAYLSGALLLNVTAAEAVTLKDRLFIIGACYLGGDAIYGYISGTTMYVTGAIIGPDRSKILRVSAFILGVFIVASAFKVAYRL